MFRAENKSNWTGSRFSWLKAAIWRQDRCDVVLVSAVGEAAQESLGEKNLIPLKTITTLCTHRRRGVISATSRRRRLSNYVRNCIWPTWSDSDDPYLESQSLFISSSEPPPTLSSFFSFLFVVGVSWWLDGWWEPFKVESPSPGPAPPPPMAAVRCRLRADSLPH